MTFRQAAVLRAFAVWTVWIWGTRIWNLIGDDEHGVAFKAVHAALAAVSVVFAVVAWRVVSTVRRGAEER